MRKGLLFILLFGSQIAFAQQQKSFKKSTNDVGCPKFYIGLNLGLENPNGILGVSFDVPIIEHVSARAGIGLSSWGYKFYGEGVGYIGKCHRSWAAGLGVSRNTGLPELKSTMPTTTGDREVTLEYLPQTNAFFNLYHYFNLGKRKSRFYLQAGYSVPLSDKSYNIKSGHVLTSDGEKVMKLLRPGGLSLGLGFYFRVGSSRR